MKGFNLVEFLLMYIGGYWKDECKLVSYEDHEIEIKDVVGTETVKAFWIEDGKLYIEVKQ